MTYEETIAQLTVGVRLKIAGALVHSVDLNYTESDGSTSAQTDINRHPYIATVQSGGHTISIRIDGSIETTQGNVYARQYTVTADAPFWVAFTGQLGQVPYREGTYPNDVHYIGSDLRESTPHFSHGDTTALYDITTELSQLWETCTIQGKYNFGGIITANIDWCTYKPLRNRNNGILLRDPTTGKILVDC